jgi:hypothetical protein
MPSKTMPTVQPFGRRNFHIFIVALGILALGYTLLAIPPVDGFFSHTAAPLLLVLGYCVLVPWALLTPASAPLQPSLPKQTAFFHLALLVKYPWVPSTSDRRDRQWDFYYGFLSP